jgi:hypothetical protein
MDNIDLYELIERYLLNKTSPEETAEIERRIESDPSFAREVQLNRDMQQLINDHSLLNIKHDLNNIRKRRISKIKSRNKFYRNLLIGSSGIIILTISSLLLLNKKYIAVRPVPETSEVSGTLDDTSMYLSESKDLNKSEQVKEHKPKGVLKDVTDSGETTDDEKVSGSYSLTDSTDKSQLKPVEIFKEDEDGSPVESQQPYTGSNDITPEEKQIPCNIKAEFLTEPSCNNSPTGLIRFIESSVSGGTAPYQFALNGIFSDSLVYRNLLPGLYNIAIRDASNCIKEWKMVEIEKINCFGEFKFAPLYGEIWKIPAETGHPGILTITNKSGKIVYQLKFDGLSELTWNGMSLNNEMLPMGAYPFIIKYQNGNVFRGTVTIVK